MSILTVEETATRLRCSERTVYRLFERGELKGFRLGKRGDIRIPEGSIAELMERWANKPPEQRVSVAVPKTKQYGRSVVKLTPPRTRPSGCEEPDAA